jgi:hypothetical protein
MYNMNISIGSYKMRVEILVAIVVVYWIMFGHLLCGCSKVGLFEGMEILKEGIRNPAVARRNYYNNTTEGFTSANNTSMGPEFASIDAPKYIMNPSTWAMPTLTYSPGTKPDAGVQKIWDRPKQPIPPPEGQLNFFATTEFKPECCPSSFSTSTGCACLDMGSYNFLKNRGGNNVPFSDY